MSDLNDDQTEPSRPRTPRPRTSLRLRLLRRRRRTCPRCPAPTEPPEETPAAERSPYLERAKMLPIEGVVYCLEHDAVHDDTTDPYDYGKPDCKEKEHRPIYYRGRKGDLDEVQEKKQEQESRRVIAKANAEELTDPEREIVLLLVDHAAKRTEDAAALMHEVWPDDNLIDIRVKLALLDSVNDKLGDE